MRFLFRPNNRMLEGQLNLRAAIASETGLSSEVAPLRPQKILQRQRINRAMSEVPPFREEPKHIRSGVDRLKWIGAHEQMSGVLVELMSGKNGAS